MAASAPISPRIEPQDQCQNQSEPPLPSLFSEPIRWTTFYTIRQTRSWNTLIDLGSLTFLNKNSSGSSSSSSSAILSIRFAQPTRPPNSIVPNDVIEQATQAITWVWELFECQMAIKLLADRLSDCWHAGLPNLIRQPFTRADTCQWILGMLEVLDFLTRAFQTYPNFRPTSYLFRALPAFHNMYNFNDRLSSSNSLPSREWEHIRCLIVQILYRIYPESVYRSLAIRAIPHDDRPIYGSLGLRRFLTSILQDYWRPIVNSHGAESNDNLRALNPSKNLFRSPDPHSVSYLPENNCSDLTSNGGEFSPSPFNLEDVLTPGAWTDPESSEPSSDPSRSHQSENELSLGPLRATQSQTLGLLPDPSSFNTSSGQHGIGLTLKQMFEPTLPIYIFPKGPQLSVTTSRQPTTFPSSEFAFQIEESTFIKPQKQPESNAQSEILADLGRSGPDATPDREDENSATSESIGEVEVIKQHLLAIDPAHLSSCLPPILIQDPECITIQPKIQGQLGGPMFMSMNLNPGLDRASSSQSMLVPATICPSDETQSTAVFPEVFTERAGVEDTELVGEPDNQHTNSNKRKREAYQQTEEAQGSILQPNPIKRSPQGVPNPDKPAAKRGRPPKVGAHRVTETDHERISAQTNSPTKQTSRADLTKRKIDDEQGENYGRTVQRDCEGGPGVKVKAKRGRPPKVVNKVESLTLIKIKIKQTPSVKTREVEMEQGGSGSQGVFKTNMPQEQASSEDASQARQTRKRGRPRTVVKRGEDDEAEPSQGQVKRRKKGKQKAKEEKNRSVIEDEPVERNEEVVKPKVKKTGQRGRPRKVTQDGATKTDLTFMSPKGKHVEKENHEEVAKEDRTAIENQKENEPSSKTSGETKMKRKRGRPRNAERMKNQVSDCPQASGSNEEIEPPEKKSKRALKPKKN